MNGMYMMCVAKKLTKIRSRPAIKDQPPNNWVEWLIGPQFVSYSVWTLPGRNNK